ncbi:hypothetical protein [Thioalkalivibrio sp. ALE11]|uniref:hypothetical protein n=1 Tax=Thioalkalivibrio sp. ALE11 TaxID=1265494 RepID=UPI0004771580|nr:hypothetical protein [Thioalkalivibrio sp. ALE11]
MTNAVRLVLETDIKGQEEICDEIFREQPNLLASVLVLTKMRVAPEYIQPVLQALMVAHVALKASGERIKTITEDEQERELHRLVASIKFSEDMAPELVEESITQYVGFQNEPWFLAYVVFLLHDNGLLSASDENTKHVLLSALNLVGCIANAQDIA